MQHICNLNDIPLRGSRVVRLGATEIALFKTGEGKVFALKNHCPHKGGKLSEGIVHGEEVTCPLHGFILSLKTGQALGADEGCVETFPVQINGESVRL